MIVRLAGVSDQESSLYGSDASLMHAAPNFQPLGSVALFETGTMGPEDVSSRRVAVAVAKNEA